MYTSNSQPSSQRIFPARPRPHRPGITEDFFRPTPPAESTPLLGVTIDEHGSPAPSRRIPLFTDLSNFRISRTPRTPRIRPHFLSEDVADAPLSPTSRSPTRLDPRVPPFHPHIRYNAGTLQLMTPEEDAYMTMSEQTRIADANRESTAVRRKMAALMQESLDRIGPQSGVRRVEDWEKRHAVMEEMGRYGLSGGSEYWEVGDGEEEDGEGWIEVGPDSGYGSEQGDDEEGGLGARVIEQGQEDTVMEDYWVDALP